MCATAAQPFAWQAITASEAGIAPDLGDRIDAAHRNGELRGLHGLVMSAPATACTGIWGRFRSRPGLGNAWSPGSARSVMAASGSTSCRASSSP
jgi:hypothetical protein